MYSEGPITSTSIYLKNSQDTNTDSDKPSVPFLFNGFDNQFASGFKVSILVLEPIKNGQIISISNSNYSATSGWLPKNGSKHEQITLYYTGDNIILPGSILCVAANTNNIISSDFSGNTKAKVNVLVNGQFNDQFKVDHNVSNSFFNHLDWSSLYLFNTNFISSVNTQAKLTPVDGITVGIKKSNFPFDTPFSYAKWQLFFFEEAGSYFGFINCVDKIGCEFIEFFKNIENWTVGLGSKESELDLNEICLKNCNLLNCSPTNIVVQENCLGNKVDVLFLIDESSSINGGDIPNIKNSVKKASETIKCMIEDSRFAVSAFSSTNKYHNVINFQSETVNIDNYNFQGGGTNVYSAYQKLLEDLNSGGLQLRKDAKFIIILLTDAGASYMPFVPSNAIKSAPYYASNLVIYFKDGNYKKAIPFAAAIASKGGSYIGDIYNNPNDPEGQGPPRKLFIYDDVVPDISEAIGSFNDCGELEFIATPTVKIIRTTSVSNGGKVLSIESNVVKTNGTGSYTFEVFLDNKCSYEVSYDFGTSNKCIVIPNENILTKRSNKDDHSKYELNLNEKEQIINLNISPNPTSNKLLVVVNNIDIDKSSKLKIYSVDGILIDEYHVTSSEQLLDVSKYTPGEYIINLYQNSNLLSNKTFVVIK